MKKVLEYIAIGIFWVLTLPMRVGMQIELAFYKIFRKDKDND